MTSLEKQEIEDMVIEILNNQTVASVQPVRPGYKPGLLQVDASSVVGTLMGLSRRITALEKRE